MNTRWVEMFFGYLVDYRAVNSRREVGSRDYSGSIVTNSINVNVGGGEENTFDTSDMFLQLLNGKVEITK